MGKGISPKVLLEAAALLASIAHDVENECLAPEPLFRPTPPRTPRRPLGCGCTNHTAPRRPFIGECISAPRAPWGVAKTHPLQDKNKVFGVNIRVDEPRASDYFSRAQFERDHAKFDRLVEAAEACTWPNKSNTAPLTKVNAIRRRIEDGPIMNLSLCGETEWFD